MFIILLQILYAEIIEIVKQAVIVTATNTPVNQPPNNHMPSDLTNKLEILYPEIDYFLNNILIKINKFKVVSNRDNC